MYVSPAGMLREIGIEAKRIASHINEKSVFVRSGCNRHDTALQPHMSATVHKLRCRILLSAEPFQWYGDWYGDEKDHNHT